MSTFKADIYDICNQVAASFPGWIFVSGQFKNKSLKHTDLIVYLGFGFENDSTTLYPGVTLNNKKAVKLCKSIIGYELATSMISFQAVAHTLDYTPERLRLGCRIVRDKSMLAAIQVDKTVQDRFIDITEAYHVLIAILKDGIAFIENNYDLSGEENFLKNLPANYTTRNKIIYDEFEKQKGVVMCIVHILLGDFDFFYRYRNNDFKTIFPRRDVELDKILSELPELKRRYAETGAAI